MGGSVSVNAGAKHAPKTQKVGRDEAKWAKQVQAATKLMLKLKRKSHAQSHRPPKARKGGKAKGGKQNKKHADDDSAAADSDEPPVEFDEEAGLASCMAEAELKLTKDAGENRRSTAFGA